MRVRKPYVLSISIFETINLELLGALMKIDGHYYISNFRCKNHLR